MKESYFRLLEWSMEVAAQQFIHMVPTMDSLSVWSLQKKPNRSPTSKSVTLVTSLLLLEHYFLWIYYPSFNYGLLAQNFFEQHLIVVNTIISLTGSVVGTYIVSSLGFGRGLDMENILNATISGGVVMGAPCSFIYRPGVALFIGCTTGIISTLCFYYLTPKLLNCIGLYDTCGIHNLHGIPGLIGGIWSSIIVAFYSTGFNTKIAAQYSNGNFLVPIDRTFHQQGGLQIAGTFCSLAIAFGIIGGLVTSCFYKEKPKYFYLDSEYFENAIFREIYKGDRGKNRYLDQK